MSHEARHYCERCDRPVVAVRPHWAWRATSVGALAFFILLAFFTGASGFLLFGAGFVVFALGAMVLGPLEERASDPPRCPECRCVVTRLPAAKARTAIAPAPRRQAA